MEGGLIDRESEINVIMLLLSAPNMVSEMRKVLSDFSSVSRFYLCLSTDRNPIGLHSVNSIADIKDSQGCGYHGLHQRQYYTFLAIPTLIGLFVLNHRKIPLQRY